MQLKSDRYTYIHTNANWLRCTISSLALRRSATTQPRYLIMTCWLKGVQRLWSCSGRHHLPITTHMLVGLIQTPSQSTRRPRNLFYLCDYMTSSNLVWISNELNAWWTFKHCISQLARLLKTILTQRVERSVYCKFMVLLFLLTASYGRRGSACSQDWGSNMSHLWFAVQIGAKWSYKTIVAAWGHYNQQFNILEIEE